MGRKVYPKYKMGSIVGRQVYGGELRHYGMPYTNAGGILAERFNEGILDLMFLAVERFSEIHPVSVMRDGHVYNRFTEGAYFHLLYFGNNDPEIEFLPLCNDNTLEYHDYIDRGGFVDLSNNSLTKEQEFRIQCLKNGLRKRGHPT
jgi:hypothetical protein